MLYVGSIQHIEFGGVGKVENKVNVASCKNRTGPCMLMLRLCLIYMGLDLKQTNGQMVKSDLP